MGRERGAANLRKFNDERSKGTMPLVDAELKACARRKLQFQSVGLLAAYVAERTGVHRTTLLRNPSYKALLYGYLSSQPGAATAVADDTEDPQVLRAKVAFLQAEVGNLRHELNRLNAQQRRVEESMAPAYNARDDVDAADFGVLLCLVLERVDSMAIDPQQRTLVDLAARPSARVVAQSERVSAFIDWMQRNRSLPFVQKVRWVQP